MKMTTSAKWNAATITLLVLFVVSAATVTTAFRNPDAANAESLLAEEPQPVAANHGASGAVIEHATVETFEDRVLRSRVPVVVDFYADWCGPCQIQGRILKDFAAEFDEGKIVKVDVDRSPELAVRYNVQGLPTLLIFQDGKVIARQVGLATKKQLKAALAG